MPYAVLGDDVQPAVASQAAGEWCSVGHEIELPQHFDQLSRAVAVANAVS
jgi:hypothetical protein